MSSTWSSASSSSSFVGMKPVASFADALKRLAEHVEQKNKTIEMNSTGIASYIQSTADVPHRTMSSHSNSSMSPEETLRLYTQFIHEAERREDMRRCYLRAYGGADASQLNAPHLNRRLDMVDPYRCMTPHLSSLLPPPAHLQTLTQQMRIALPASFLLPGTKSTDAPSRAAVQENPDRKSELLIQGPKSTSKIFRPYDLDSSELTSRRALSSSPISTKKPTACSHDTESLDEESPTAVSVGKEKQLLNSLGLAQPSVDNEASPSMASSDDSLSAEMAPTKLDNQPHASSPSAKADSVATHLKRKSPVSFDSKESLPRKQPKLD